MVLYVSALFRCFVPAGLQKGRAGPEAELYGAVTNQILRFLIIPVKRRKVNEGEAAELAWTDVKI